MMNTTQNAVKIGGYVPKGEVGVSYLYNLKMLIETTSSVHMGSVKMPRKRNTFKK